MYGGRKRVRKRHILNVTREGAARIWHRDIYSNWSTRRQRRIGGGVWFATALFLRCYAQWWRCETRRKPDESVTSPDTDEQRWTSSQKGSQHQRRWHYGIHERVAATNANNNNNLVSPSCRRNDMPTRFHRAMLCNASAVLAMGLCPSVCHKSVFYRNGWTKRAGFWHVSFFPHILHCIKRKFDYLQK